MTKSSNRVSLSRRVLKAVGSIKAMLFSRLFRSSVYESVRPTVSNRLGWLDTLASLVGRGSQDVHRGGVLKVSAKERAKRSAAREFRRRFVMAEQLELRALMAADLGIDLAHGQQPIAAEVGAMVPGQASSSQNQPNSPFFTVVAASGFGTSEANLAEGVARASQRLSAFSGSDGYSSIMREVFGRTSISDTALSAAVAGLQSQWATGELGVRVEVLSGSSMSGGLGAFAADYQGSPAIFINGDWLASNPGADAVAKVLIEEFGHSLDRRINAGADSPGDEGELFSNRVVGSSLSRGELIRILSENDFGRVVVEGQAYSAEFVAFNASLAFNENGNSITAGTGLVVSTGTLLLSGAGGNDFNGSTGVGGSSGPNPITFRITNVQAGDFLDFGTPLTGWTARYINLRTDVTGQATGATGITYTVSVNSTTTDVVFSFPFNNSRSKSDCQAIANSVRFLSTSQNPARLNNPVVSVWQAGSSTSNPGPSPGIAATVTVSNRNDAPVLDTAINPTLSAQGNAGAPVNGVTAGTQVSTLLTGVSDVDDSPATGMAIVALSNTNLVTLWYSTNSGTTWTRVDAAGAISATSALLLSATASNRLYLQPANNVAFSGSVLTFRAWDNTGTGVGTPGTRANVGTPTGNAPDNVNSYSTATDVVDGTVTPFTNNPAVVTAGATLGYTENGAAAVIDNTITVTDSDSTNMSSATVSVSFGFTTGDVLAYTNANGITGSYDSGTGVLTLTGSATPATYATALKSVSYSSTSDHPTATNSSRRIAWVVNDGNSNSTAVTSTVNITAVNDAPTFTGTISGTYTEGVTPLVLVSTAAVSDVDASNFNGGSVTVSLASYQAGDVLSINNQGVGATQIGVTGSNVTYGGVTIGTFLGGSASNLVITFNSSSATPVAVQALMGQLRFSSTSSNPTNFGLATTRSVTVTLNDGGNTGSGGALTANITGTINVSAVNSAPTFTGTVSGTYTEGDAPLVLVSNASVSDVDASNFNNGSVTVSLATYRAGDVLSINNQGTSAGQIGVSGGVVSFGGTSIGTFSGGSAANLVISLNSNATPTAVQALMGQLLYASTSSNPTNFGAATTRSVTVTLNDGGNTGSGGVLTANVTGTINVSAVNNAPTMTAGGTLAYTENGPASAIDATLTVSDVDNANLTGATVTISTNFTTGDTLGFTNQGTISLNSYNATTGVLTLTGTATVAQYQTALQSVTFRSTSDNPTSTAASRTISWTVTDGSLNSTAVTSTVNITAVNDAPVVYLAGGTTQNILRQFQENGGAVQIAPAAVVLDADSTQLQSLTITLTNAQDGAAEVLTASAGSTGLVITGNNTGTLTISGSGTVADYQSVLRTVAYNNTSDNPTTSPVRTITVVARDNESANSLNSSASTSSVSLASVNNAPVYNTGISNQTLTTGLPFSFSFPSNAFTDAENDPLTYTAQVAGGSLPSWLTFNATTRKFYGVPPTLASPITVTVTAQDPSGATATKDFTISTVATLNGNPIASVGFATAYNLVNASVHSNSNYYQEETNSFTTASAPYQGTNFVFFQDGTTTFSGNNVPGKLMYINSSGDVVTVPPAGVGSVSRPIKTPGNVVQGYYMWNNAGTAGSVTDDTATLLVVNPNYFTGNAVYNSSSDQVDTALNGYLTAVTFDVASASADEGTASPNNINFVVTRSSGSGTASVQFATSISGTNNASSNDFVASSGTANFAAGQTSVTISIATRNDAVFEPNETFTLTLTNPTVNDGQVVQGRLLNATATGTIVNDEAAPTFSIANSGAEEGTPPASGNTMTFTVTRNGASDVSQSVSYATSLSGTGEGFASADDFTSVSGTLTFAPGETTKTFTVTTVADDIVEIDEVFAVGLSNATNGAAVSQTNGTAVGTIEDDESTSIYSVSPASITEGGTLTFTVTRTRDVDVPQTISFYTSTTGDTATSGSAGVGDFVGVANNATPTGAQTLIFAPGEFSKTFNIATNQDALYEGDETFTVVLYSLQDVSPRPTKISTFNGTAKGTIVDNDTLPVFSVSVAPADASGVVESVGGVGQTIRFVITRTALSEAIQTIDYTTVIRDSDTASDADFVPASGTLSFPSSGANSLSQTVTVTLRNDVVAESAETFGFRISNPSISASSLGTPSVATGTILDSNQAPTTGTTSVTAIEDTRYIFQVSDFSYSDTEGAGLSSIKVTTLPDALAGKLQKATARDGSGNVTSWADVTVDEVISVIGVNGLGAGGLSFLPVADKNTQNLAANAVGTNGVVSFNFQVNDGQVFSTGSGTVSISITPVNDPPTGGQVGVANAHQRETYLFTDSEFGFQDNANDSNSRLSVIITSLPGKGKLRYDGSDVALNQSGVFEVTYADIMAGKLVYVPGDNDPPANPSTTFKFKVRDDGGTANNGNDTSPEYTFAINLLDYRGPSQSVPIEQRIDEDATLVFTGSKALTVSFIGDATNTDKTLKTIVSVPADKGTLTLGSTPSGLSVSGNRSHSVTLIGSAAQINTALDGMTYAPPANANSLQEADKHTYTTLTMTTDNSQGNGTQWPLDTDTVDIGVRPVNDAPVVVSGQASVSRSIDEDPATNSGYTVSSLFTTSFDDSADEVNGGTSTNDFAGLAIHSYAAAPSKGTWQYSADGTSWSDISSIAGLSTSLLIPASYRLRFVPAASFNGAAPSLEAKLIDTSSGALSGVTTVDLSGGSAIGGTTRYSSGSVTLSLTVNPVNDAPVATGSSSLVAVAEDSANPPGATVSNLFAARFNDSTDQVAGGSNANNFAGIAITSYTAASNKGDWQYNNGSGWTTLANVTGASSSTLLPEGSSLRFLPKSNFNGPAPTITAVLIDDSSGAVSFGTGVNIGTTGGITQYSSSTVVLSHNVTAVNDAPVASGSASLPAILEGNTEPVGSTVATLFNPSFSDVTDSVIGGSTANTLAGVAIRSYVEDTSKGTWQYSTDNGANWTNLTAINPASDASAFALKRTDMLRFKPVNDDYNSTDAGAVPVLVARLIDSSYQGTLATGSLDVSINGGTTPYSTGNVTLTTSVTSVNDRPVSQDQTVTAIEDTTYTLTKGNFGFDTGFDDPKDNPDNKFVKVIIKSLPSGGTLRLNGSNVQVDDTISIRDIEDGKLTYTPAANVNGTDGVNGFVAPRIGFRVQDDGGVVNGGGQAIDTSAATYTVTINITSVNDAPSSASFSVTTDEDTDYTFSTGNFPFADATDSSANSIQSVIITSLPGIGTLKLSGTAVTVGQVISVSQLGNLVFTPNANSNGNAYAKVGFKVQDNGGTANGGVDTSVANYTVTINVTPVNDQPVATGNASLSSSFKNSPDANGATVSSLFGSLYSDPNDQPNPNSFTGVAITGLTDDSSKGTWEYQPAAGGSWVALGTVTSNSSITLKSSDRLRFIPANNYVGNAPQITVRLIENVTPTTGATVDLTNPSILTPSSNYSSNTSTLDHEVKGGLLVRGLSDVSEGSAAVFTVDFDQPTTSDVLLTLSNNSGSTETDDFVWDFNGTSTWDSSKVNVYYIDGSTRVVLPVSGGVVSVSSLTRFYVSVPTNNDSIYEGPESLRLAAQMPVVSPLSTSSDISTILDNGYGVVYKDDATPQSSYSPDNDLSVVVSAFSPVNEGSDYAFFTVTGASGDTLRLSVVNGTTSLVAPRIEYAVVSTTTGVAQWTQYDGASNSPVVPGGLGTGTGTVYVRVSIASEQDDTFEGSESFTLTATSVTNGSVSDSDDSAIVDAGNGLKFGPEITDGVPASSSSNLDDDRGLSVTSYAAVNEGSTYHMFKVTGPAGVPVNLSIEGPASGRPADEFASFTFQYSTDKITWTTYTWDGSTGNRPTVPAGSQLGSGEVFVRVDITTEMDTSVDPADWFEGSEKFQLKASTDAGKVARGTGEILDDGLGGLYTGAWGTTDPTTTTGQLEDDRLWAVNDHVDSPVLSTVTINARSNDRAVAGVTISDVIDLDPSTPDIVDSQYVVSGQGTWRVVSGNVTYSPLSTYRADPSPISYAIRPTDRTNFSKKTATIDIDFPVGTSADGNVPAVQGTAVTIPVLANDTFGDTPVGSTLRFSGRANGDQSSLFVDGQGTWSINPTTFAITFTPVSGYTDDPTPQRYVVEDADGNVSAATLVTVTYKRDSRFVVQINNDYIADPTGFDVVIVDNVTTLGSAIVVGKDSLGNDVTVTPNRADTDLTVGRIVWAGAVGAFSRVTIDAKSKPITTGTMADISLVTSVTSSSGGNVEVRASDMSYSLNAGTFTLASPIAGTNNGIVRFSETVGLTNQAFTAVANPTSLSSVFNTSDSTNASGLTNRSLSWSGTRSFTLALPAQVSLAKAIRVVHGSSTRTTQLTAGGKLVETSGDVDLAPYTNWVLPSATGLAAPIQEDRDRESGLVGVGLMQDLPIQQVVEYLKNREFFATPIVDNHSVLLNWVGTEDTSEDADESTPGVRRFALRSANFKRV